MTISDETLMAFMDGELSEAERRDVQAALDAAPELAARLQAFTASDAWLKDSAEALDDIPMRADTLGLVDSLADRLGRGAAPRHTAADNVVAFSPKPSFGAVVRDMLLSRQAVAASVALLVGLGLGTQIRVTAPAPEQDALYAYQAAGLYREGTPGFAALENAPSMDLAESGAAFTPVATFRSVDGGLCREFEASADGVRSRGIACRRDDGWLVRATASAPLTRDAAGTYTTASGEADGAIDTLMGAMIKGDILSRAEEEALIRLAWK